MYMYVDIIDKVTKCHFLCNGDQCKVLLKKKRREEKPEQSQAVNRGAQSRAFLRRDDASADGGTVFLKRTKKKKSWTININAVKPYWKLKRVNERVSEKKPPRCRRGGCCQLCVWFASPDAPVKTWISHSYIEPNRRVLGSSQDPRKKKVSIWRQNDYSTLSKWLYCEHNEIKLVITPGRVCWNPLGGRHCTKWSLDVLDVSV